MLLCLWHMAELSRREEGCESSVPWPSRPEHLTNPWHPHTPRGRPDQWRPQAARASHPQTPAASVGWGSLQEKNAWRTVKSRNWKGEQRKTCCIICKVRNPLTGPHAPCMVAIIRVTSGTAAAVFSTSLSLLHRNSSPDARSPQSHEPERNTRRRHPTLSTGIRWLVVRHRGAKPFLTTAGRRHLHHTVEQRMQFGCPLPGAAGDHVDLTDALVIQQEHRLLLLKKWQKHDYDDDDNAGGLLLFNSFDCILTFPSQQKRGHGFFRLMLDDNTTSSCRSMFRRRHWLFLLHSASRE